MEANPLRRANPSTRTGRIGIVCGMTVSAAPKITRDAYPALYQVADSSSVAGQRVYRRLVQTELAFIIAGATFGAISAFVTQSKPIFPSLAAICLVAGIAMKLVNRQSSSDERWFDGRAVAETVKTQTWRYMMGIPPYQGDTADDVFATDVMSAMEARPNLAQPLDVLPEDPSQISAVMRAVRALPLDQRRELYLDQRLADQANWYKGRALANQRHGRRWFWVSLIAQVVATAIAVTTIFDTEQSLGSLVGLFAAVATAATAWTQLGRHDELSKSYAMAYQELITIRTLGQRATTDAALERLVTDGEGAISREHTMWMAKRADPIRTSPARRGD